ncbi:hypothetical protein GHI93_11455 [Lactococcus hircilactis]|uniref:Uncharacterized protein n=1 Tax=Lactococcus hircilactis TaxID=1494462 RepID=A0A7X2D1H2_9LACT|nr:hypothetical protein [Lactococcus hircilactis]MQW40536.1 hypothetical protein [Lactococcus hircilactis]
MKNKLYNYVKNFVIAMFMLMLMYVVIDKFFDISSVYKWITVLIFSAIIAWNSEDK